MESREPRRPHRQAERRGAFRTLGAAFLLAAAALPALLLGACGGGGSSPTSPDASALFVVEVAGQETFRIRLQDPEKIAQAQGLLETGEVRVVSGELRAGNGGFNAPYRWHLDPATVEFPDVAIEVCDGLPSQVEANLDHWLNVVRRYCPWSSRIVARES